MDIIGDSDLTENEIVLTSGFLADTKEGQRSFEIHHFLTNMELNKIRIILSI